MEQHRTVIIYDVANNKRRYRVIKVLERFGVRVQKSVFEANLSEKQWEQIIKEVGYWLNEEEDSFRMYDISGCRKEITLGLDVPPPDDDCLIF